MIGRLSACAFIFACVGLGAACSVDGSFLDTELFLCEGPSECGADWGCVRATPYAADFCAPDCSESCDGVCVVQGESESCLQGCRILDDFTTSECPPDFDCIRVSAQNDDGVCYPVRGCNESADCTEDGEDLECLTALVQVPSFGINVGALRADNLYCVPAPEDPANCPPRSVHTDIPFEPDPDFDMCLPLCDASDTRCPPAFGCLSQLAGISRSAVCLPGIYGIPCDDDTNCLLGSCIDTGASGKFCTTSCAFADRLAFGCENLSRPLNLLNLPYRLECDASANGGADGGLCAPRYEIGIACTQPETSTFACAEGLECLTIVDGAQKICTKACVADADCNQEGRSRGNFCSSIFDVCLPQFAEGETGCVRDGNCVTNSCVAGTCTAPP